MIKARSRLAITRDERLPKRERSRTHGQGARLLAYGHGVATKSTVRCAHQNLTWEDGSIRPVGCERHGNNCVTVPIDGIATNDDERSNASLFGTFYWVKSSEIDFAPQYLT
jgi:hypothetical protein